MPQSKTPTPKQAFLAVKTNVRINRTYGGSTYTLKLYEIKNRELVYIDETQADTRGHAGEISEAYQKLRDIKAIKPGIWCQIKNAASDPVNKNYSYNSYYSWTMEEKFGLKITVIE